MQVLVADDDAAFAAPLGRTLSGWGWSVTVVADGPSALDAIVRGRPDAAILCWMLPRLDGWRICHRLRQAGLRGTRLVLAVGRAFKADAAIELRSCVDGIIGKPLDLGELREALSAAPTWAPEAPEGGACL